MLQSWAPSNGTQCVPIVFSLMSSKWAKFHPTNRSNVYESQARRQDFAAGSKNHKGEQIFKCNVGCMQQPPRKKSLVICKRCSHLTRPRQSYRYERRNDRAPLFALLQHAFLVFWQKPENSFFFAKRLGLQLWSSIFGKSVNCLSVD